jgi:hypothetical protein
MCFPEEVFKEEFCKMLKVNISALQVVKVRMCFVIKFESVLEEFE